MIEPDLTEVLHRAAELLPDNPDRLAGVRRKRAARVRRRVCGLTGVVVLTAAGTSLALLTGGAAKRDVLSTATGSPSGTGSLTATGHVVHLPGRQDRFCVDLPTATTGTTGRTPIRPCELGVDVRGVDLTKLSDRRERDGAVEGRATLVGDLEGDVLVVTKQSEPEPDPTTPNLDPPCPPPPGGWPQTDNPNTHSISDYQHRHGEQVAQIAIIRPSADLAYPFLLTWGDPAAARAELGPGVCVLGSTATKADFDAAVKESSRVTFVRANGVYSYGGSSLATDGQIYAGLDAVRRTAGLEALVAKYPPGTVRVDYWLHPVQR